MMKILADDFPRLGCNESLFFVLKAFYNGHIYYIEHNIFVNDKIEKKPKK